MKTKKFGVLLVFVLLVSLVFGSINTQAENDRIGEIVDGSLLTDDTTAEYTEYSRTRGIYLNFGTGKLSNLGGHQVSVSGSTVCHRTCDEVKVTLYLQRLEGNTWVNAKTLGAVTSYNTYTVSASQTYTVAGGYYYRVKGSHTAKESGTSETCSSYTNSIWIP